LQKEKVFLATFLFRAHQHGEYSRPQASQSNTVFESPQDKWFQR
jgi:hypothetical protein